MTRIHLIEKDFRVQPVADDPSLLESGYWKYFDESIVQNLIGGKIYFHLTRKDKSYMSGTIVNIRQANGKEREDSILFQFKRDTPDERREAGEDGWGPTGLEPIGVYPYRKIV